MTQLCSGVKAPKGSRRSSCSKIGLVSVQFSLDGEVTWCDPRLYSVGPAASMSRRSRPWSSVWVGPSQPTCWTICRNRYCRCSKYHPMFPDYRRMLCVDRKVVCSLWWSSVGRLVVEEIPWVDEASERIGLVTGPSTLFQLETFSCWIEMYLKLTLDWKFTLFCRLPSFSLTSASPSIFA